MFLLKKNGEPRKYRCYCRHPELIENYDKAIADRTQMWEVHHRREEFYSQKELIERGEYYDVQPEELIFLTEAEHHNIDSACKRRGESHKGYKHSEETKRKISEANKGKKGHKRAEGAGKPPKKVLCVETGEVFDSVNEARRQTGLRGNNISAVCNGIRKTAGGYHWSFL